MGLFWNRQPPAPPPIWEYKIHTVKHGIYFHDLSTFGEVGWELVCVTGKQLIFKRPLPEYRRQTDQWLSGWWATKREMEAEDGDA
ncbi:hypothetical protein [Mesorhizobium sp. M7A.F.Ca.MR.245.00.0.0]|uniref:hypothetical protein n=1 Tax=Mesorhizobium sp. M7A.F.Ca.MR.245.00.0.0 TaxID=2496778 RepID=UPI000FD19D9D|nr:hypothetical protein [Mesorhizobium sp. M7A.F.Ca.MR.245.00.0.0]RUV53760.1 hypothetical protein EOB77_00455 [Mesorhizobium sp. M7A.F.Ca.MR.228.00.0.0]